MSNFVVYGTYYNVPDLAPARWSVNELKLSRPLPWEKALELAQREAREEYAPGCVCLSIRIVCQGKTVWQWYHD